MNATREQEIWKPVPGYEGHYEASSLGRVRSLKRSTPYLMKPIWNVGDKPHAGRYQVSLCLNGIKRVHQLHLLICTTFHGPRPEGMWCCHNDDDELNNRADNLRWDTPSGNHHDMVDLGNHHYGKRTHCKYGHEYTPENTVWRQGLRGDRYVNPNPYRLCRACMLRNNAIASQKRSAARKAAREGRRG